MQETQKLASNVEAVAEMIVAFFNGLQCNIGPETMTDFTKIVDTNVQEQWHG